MPVYESDATVGGNNIATFQGDPGPKIGPRPFWAQFFFLIFWMARGASLANLGHFAKFRVGSKFELFLERFSFITHLPPDHWGG